MSENKKKKQCQTRSSKTTTISNSRKNKQTNKKKTNKKKTKKKKREKEKTVFNLTTIFGHHSKAIHGDVLNV